MENLELQKVANEVRKDIVTALHAAKAGHPGGSLSAADFIDGIITWFFLANKVSLSREYPFSLR